MKKYFSLFITLIMIFSLTSCGNKNTSKKSNKVSISKEVSSKENKSNNEKPKESTKEKVIVMDSSNLGYPSIYTVSSKGRGYLLVSFIFDTLTWKDENGVVPLIAKDWTVSEDKLQWTFNLTDTAEFTDGEKLTSEDVKFSYEYMMKHPHHWVNLNPIDKIETPDEYTIKITLKEVYAPFLTDIAGNVPIMPKHIWENVEEPEKFNNEKAIIGSGPLMLKKYYKDQGSYEFTANKDYFLGKPVIDKLILKSTSNSMESLKNGEIDVAQYIKYGQAQQLKKEGNFKVIEGPGFWVLRTYFNFDIPALNQKDFRQALYYAINRNEICEKATRNGTTPGNPGHIHPDSEWYSKDIKEYDFNKNKAIELLESTNMKDTNNDGIREFNGEKLSFEFLTPEDKVKESEMIKKYLKDIGIEINIKAVDMKSVDTLVKEGKFQIALKGHGSFGGDPVLLARFVSPGVKIGSTPVITAQGGTQWSNKEFDEIFQGQLKELNKDKRFEDVSKLQKIIAEELPTLTIYYKKITSAYNENKFDGWFFTKDGVAISVPTIQNKLIFVNGEWKEDQE